VDTREDLISHAPHKRAIYYRIRDTVDDNIGLMINRELELTIEERDRSPYHLTVYGAHRSYCGGRINRSLARQPARRREVVKLKPSLSLLADRELPASFPAVPWNPPFTHGLDRQRGEHRQPPNSMSVMRCIPSEILGRARA